MGLSTNNETVRGSVARVTRVDGCGDVIYGDDSQAVTKSFVSVARTGNTTSNDEIDLKDADGVSSVYEPARENYAGASLEITFSRVDPEFFEIVTKQRVIRDAFGRATGFAINKKVDVYLEAFALEVWSGTVAGVCDPNGNLLRYRGLWPFVQGGRLGDYTIENGAVSFVITGAQTYSGTQWGVGPYNITLDENGDPSPELEPLLVDDHEVINWVPLAPPTPFIGARPLMNLGATAISAIVAAEGDSPSEVEVTFTGATAVPVWVEWGDGTWSYIEDATDGGAHTYLVNGTYTIRATTNQTWVSSTPVVIPFP